MDKSQSVTSSRVSLGRFAEQLNSTVGDALSIGPLHCLRSHKFLCLLSCLSKPTFYSDQCKTNFGLMVVSNYSSVCCRDTKWIWSIPIVVFPKLSFTLLFITSEFIIKLKCHWYWRVKCRLFGWNRYSPDVWRYLLIVTQVCGMCTLNMILRGGIKIQVIADLVIFLCEGSLGK